MLLLTQQLCPAGLDSDDAIEAMFDGISYDKGGSVLRMLHAYLNATLPSGDTFLAGLSQYLQVNPQPSMYTNIHSQIYHRGICDI